MSTPTVASESPEETALDSRPALRAFVAHAETRQMVEKAAIELALDSFHVAHGTVADAIRVFGVERSPRLLVVELDGSDTPLERVDELAEVCEPGTAVVVLGRANDVGLFRELLRRGVSDYLVVPVPWPVLLRSLGDALEGREPARRTMRGGRTVLVFGARGGVGVTRLATLLAHRLATLRRRRVALFDLDPTFGDVALAFDLDPSPALREVFEDPARADGLWVERAGRTVGDALWIFAAEEPLDAWPPAPAGGLPAVAEALRRRFHYVLFDCPVRPVETLTAALEQSDLAFLVCEATLAGIRDVLRLLRHASEVNASCHVYLVLNRPGARRGGGIDRGDFARAVGRDVDFVLPFDPAIAEAADRGRPPARLARASARVLDAMVERLAGTATAESPLTRLPLIGRLLG